ncbi:MAG: hypothetical protein M3Y57_05340 [Acidobacteriota bacterium]|nr:hypothetical protein [Acidobacteriota bacterium]
MKIENVRIAVEALMREDIVADLYEQRGYRILSRTEDDTRALFGMPMGPTADIVVEVSSRKAIIAEVKGSDVARALIQLKQTALYVRRKYDLVECKMFVKTPTPSSDTIGLRGGSGEEGRLGFLAMRIYNRHFPAEWLLLKCLDGGGREFVKIDDEQVCLIFGPYAKI